MNNEEFIKQIAEMDIFKLFDVVMKNPEYLTDYYYVDFGDAIRARYAKFIE